MDNETSALEVVFGGAGPAGAQPPRRVRRPPSTLAIAALAGLTVGLAITLVVVLDARHDRASRTDACRLLSAAHVAAAVRSTAEAGKPATSIRPEPGEALCGYRTSSRFGTVVVAEQRPGRVGFETSRQRAERGGDAYGYHPVPGLGDRAFASGSSVSVLMKDTFVVVYAQDSRPEFEPIARRLAARVVLRHRGSR